jgi:AraC-like DNA-binding protein
MAATLIDLAARRARPPEPDLRPARLQVSPDPEALVPDEVIECLRAEVMLRDPCRYMELHPEIAAFEQFGAEHHYRFDCADGQITGHGELIALADGFLMQLSDAEARWPRVISVSSPDVLRIRISLEGSECCSRDGERAMTTEGPTVLVVLEPPAQPPTRVVFSGRQGMVQMFADREALQQLWNGREHELPGLLQAFLAGTMTQTASRRLPLKSDLLRCLDDLRRCDQEGLARTLFMRAKGFESFCHVLKMMEIEEGFGGADASLVTSRGVLRAQQILKQRFVAPPSLDDLAREVGISRSSLCAGFRQIVGQSIGGYIQELRMERALELLSDSSEAITEIAYQVGYCHQSSFTVAIQRRFGMSPSELRRSARPLEPS